jgi:hypothetical protein
MKIRSSKTYRGIGKTNIERLDQALVEVPSKEEIAKLNLIKSIFNIASRPTPKMPTFGTIVLSQRTLIRVG